MKTKYYFCATFNDLVHLVSGHIKDFDNGFTKDFGEITISLDDTPSYAEASGMTQEELKDVFKDSSGRYGVKTVDLFDQDITTVLVGYYGGNTVQCFTVDSDCGITQYIPRLNRQVSEALSHVMLSNCDEGFMRNFLVEIKYDTGVKNG